MSNHHDVFSLYDLEAGIPRALSNGIKAQVFHGEQSTMMIARFGPNMPGRIHKHAHEQWHLVLEGSCIRIHEGEEVACQQGDFWRCQVGIFNHFLFLRYNLIGMMRPPKSPQKLRSQKWNNN